MNYREMTVNIVALLLGFALLSMPFACTMNRHRLIAEAIKNGADPIAAKCAIEGDTSMTPQCLMLGAARGAASKP